MKPPEPIKPVLFACLAALLALTGCSRPETVSRGSSIHTDELGRKVAIDGPPKRIISLAPSVTEMLFAIGVGDRVIGVTTWCDYPEAAAKIEKIGDTLHPDLERIIALKPDLVVITTSSQLETLSRQLDRLSIPVFVVDPKTVRGVAYSIQILGRVTGSDIAADVAAEMERRIRAVEANRGDAPGPRVLFVLQDAPLITAGRNTFINDLITLAGGISISGDETADYPQYSRETVIARAPEAIIVPGIHGTGAIDVKALARAFATTPAIRNDRIIRVNPDWVSRPGPRLVDGLEQLATALQHRER